MNKDEAIVYLIEAGKSGSQFVNVPRDVLLALEDKPKKKATDGSKHEKPGNVS